MEQKTRVFSKPDVQEFHLWLSCHLARVCPMAPPAWEHQSVGQRETLTTNHPILIKTQRRRDEFESRRC